MVMVVVCHRFSIQFRVQRLVSSSHTEKVPSLTFWEFEGPPPEGEAPGCVGRVLDASCAGGLNGDGGGWFTVVYPV